jgi:hypothetical protein
MIWSDQAQTPGHPTSLAHVGLVRHAYMCRSAEPQRLLCPSKLRTSDRLACGFWTLLTLPSHRPCVSSGKFRISSTTERCDQGAYWARVTVSSGRGPSSHHRITRFARPFASAEAAHLVALTHGWLQTLRAALS